MQVDYFSDGLMRTEKEKREEWNLGRWHVDDFADLIRRLEILTKSIARYSDKLFNENEVDY